MTELRSRIFVFAGRLSAMPRRAAAERLRAFGAVVRSTLSRRTDYLVVGHNAHDLVESGRLESLLREAARNRVRVISENAFLRRVGARPPLPPATRTLALADLLAAASLNAATGRLLRLFDVIEADEQERFGFPDLVAAREVGRLLAEGVSIAAVLGAVAALRRRVPDPGWHLARFKVAATPEGRVVLGAGEMHVDYDGQIELPLAAGPALESDLFADAEAAEAAGDLAAAEALYRRCLDHDRHDPTVPFNLANVLRERGRAAEARLYLLRALALDPGMAEAWYNLADLDSAAGRRAEAKAHLQKALEIDPDYADALYNLAWLQYQDGELADAAGNWERYLRFDAGSDWGRRARDGIGACRLLLANSEP